MNYNNDFRHDLELGNLGEKALGDILSNKTVEVKTDFRAQETGNVFIEYESRGHSSGIATTEADYWCFVLSNDQLAILTTKKTKELSRQYYAKGRIVAGGDSNTSMGVLVPVVDLLRANNG